MPIDIAGSATPLSRRCARGRRSWDAMRSCWICGLRTHPRGRSIARWAPCRIWSWRCILFRLMHENSTARSSAASIVPSACVWSCKSGRQSFGQRQQRPAIYQFVPNAANFRNVYSLKSQVTIGAGHSRYRSDRQIPPLPRARQTTSTNFHAGGMAPFLRARSTKSA